MTVSRFIRPAAAMLCAGLVLSACGSEQGPESQVLKAVAGKLTGRKAAAPKVTPQQIAQILQATPNPLALFQIESRDNAQILMVEIETNGPYHTFGTQARNVIVMRDGMITSTRGITGDLMSVEEDALLSLVAARAAGTATYVQRFLTPEGVTQELTYSCTTHPGQGDHIAIGGAAAARTAMISASCVGDDTSFTNSYAVTGDGVILAGRQWLGAYTGYVISKYLRR